MVQLLMASQLADLFVPVLAVLVALLWIPAAVVPLSVRLPLAVVVSGWIVSRPIMLGNEDMLGLAGGYCLAGALVVASKALLGEVIDSLRAAMPAQSSMLFDEGSQSPCAQVLSVAAVLLFTHVVEVPDSTAPATVVEHVAWLVREGCHVILGVALLGLCGEVMYGLVILGNTSVAGVGELLVLWRAAAAVVALSLVWW